MLLPTSVQMSPWMAGLSYKHLIHGNHLSVCIMSLCPTTLGNSILKKMIWMPSAIIWNPLIYAMFTNCMNTVGASELSAFMTQTSILLRSGKSWMQLFSALLNKDCHQNKQRLEWIYRLILFCRALISNQIPICRTESTHYFCLLLPRSAPFGYSLANKHDGFDAIVIETILLFLFTKTPAVQGFSTLLPFGLVSL